LRRPKAFRTSCSRSCTEWKDGPEFFEDAIHEVEFRLFDQHLKRFDKHINQPEFHAYKHYIVGTGRLN
tara:strand:- start:227 stop:430 length:204 start_codon:yes stop_codon:yes gene_type:complete